MTQNTSKISNLSSPDGVIASIGQEARSASAVIAQTPTHVINQALKDVAQALIDQSQVLIDINKKDVTEAEGKNQPPALIDRLMLDQDRIQSISQSVLDIAALEDPVGVVLETTERPNGLTIEKTSVPIGVLGMIYESRPNVTIDAAALCLKSHNAVILRGGQKASIRHGRYTPSFKIVSGLITSLKRW